MKIFIMLSCLCIIFFFCGCSETPVHEKLDDKKTDSAEAKESSLNSVALPVQENDKIVNLERQEKETYSLVGTWECNTDFKDQNCNLTWKVNANNTYRLYFDCDRGENWVSGTLNYNNKKLTIVTGGKKYACDILWKDINHFLLTEEDGIVNDYRRSRKKIPDPPPPTDTKQCGYCEGRGTVRCCDLGGFYKPDCLSQNVITNCMSNPNPCELRVTCCRCKGTGRY